MQLWQKHQQSKVSLLNIFKDLLQEVQARWAASCNCFAGIGLASLIYCQPDRQRIYLGVQL